MTHQRAKKDPHLSSAGFTLLELLISLSLSALLLTVLTTGLAMMTDEWTERKVGLEESIDHNLGLLQLERSLHSLFPHLALDPETDQQEVYFQGDPDEIRWVSTLSPGHHQQMSAWRLFTQPSSDHTAHPPLELHLSVIPALTGPLDQRLESPSTKSSRLLSANHLAVEYLVAPESGSEQISTKMGEKLRWVNEWPPRRVRNKMPNKRLNRVPIAIRITILGMDPREPERVDTLLTTIGIQPIAPPS